MDLHQKLMRALRVSQRTSKPHIYRHDYWSPWYDVTKVGEIAKLDAFAFCRKLEEDKQR